MPGLKPFADDPEGLLEGRSAAVPDGLEGVPDGRPDVPYEGLDAGVPDEGLFTLPDGRVALEPDGRVTLEPEGRVALEPDGRDV